MCCTNLNGEGGLMLKPILCSVLQMVVCFLVICAHASDGAKQTDTHPESVPAVTIEQLGLTPDEKEWIKRHPVLQVGGPAFFPPFHFFENRTRLRGMSADYLNTMMNDLGIRTNLHTSLSWAEVLQQAKEKKIDLIACAAKTAERESYLHFSDPYLSFPLVIVNRVEADFIGDIKDLKHQKLALVQQNIIHTWLERDQIPIVPFYVSSPRHGLEAVSFGRADAIIENLAAATYMIKKYGLTNLKIAAPTPYENYDLHMAVQKDHHQLVSIINKYLKQMTPSAHAEIQNRWLSVRYDHGISRTDILKWALPALLCISLLFVFMFIWNRRLKKESFEREKAEQKYRHLFNNAPAGMYEIDFIQNRFVSVNEVMCQYSGYTAEEFLSISPMVLLTPESRQVYIERLIRFQAGEHLSDAPEYTVVKKNGETIEITLNAEYYVKEGQIAGAHVVAHDITQIKKAEKEKITAQKMAAENEKFALVGQIAGKMAHDFNNVLSIIMGNTELCLMNCSEPQTKKWLESIFHQTLRGKNLTKNLVAFARDQEPRQVFFNLQEKTDMVISLMDKDLDGIDLVREEGADLPELLADPGMIEHAMVNLIQNAIHAVSQTSHPRIVIRINCFEAFICFEVEDNGCGIPEESLGRIYDPAFTLKGSHDTTQSYAPEIKGTGYGMSNIKKYIEQHKGNVTVQSTQGVGTRVTLFLPLIQKQLTDEEKSRIHKTKMISKKQILLVEDEKDIADVQYRVLTQRPCCHDVDIAHDGNSAIQWFDTKHYDLVSLDYILPGKINGMDVYRHIRQKNKQVPIVFISGNIAFLESIKELKQNDACIDHLSKPCLNADYVDCITQLLNGSDPH